MCRLVTLVLAFLPFSLGYEVPYIFPRIELPLPGIGRFVGQDSVSKPLGCGVQRELYSGDIYWLRSANYPDKEADNAT